ncbi:hypothetical protein VP395_08440 [Mariniflexile soesokkakense]|uniref:Uncharacterized protein n=1 Tax=Mariniflexile soesokkakense TaxID=1343160 RepID=A0ABV0A9H1_9FLAO
MTSKTEVLEYLHILLTHNLYGSTQGFFNSAYRNRFIGFRSELEFKNDFKSRRLIDGGYILPMQDKKPTLHAPLYFTITAKKPYSFLRTYSILESFPFSKMLVIHFPNYDIDSWNTIDVMQTGDLLRVPDFSVYEKTYNRIEHTKQGINYITNLFMDKTRNPNRFIVDKKIKQECFEMLEVFEIEQLIDIYVDRLVFDGFIGLGKVKGVPSDIDAIDMKENNFFLLEIKEKDLSKGNPKGFGMDTQRLNDLLSIQKLTGLTYVYMVKKVNNQKERLKDGWFYISLNDFYKHTKGSATIQGGAGMASASGNHPTLVCDFKHFKELKQ